MQLLGVSGDTTFDLHELDVLGRQIFWSMMRYSFEGSSGTSKMKVACPRDCSQLSSLRRGMK